MAPVFGATAVFTVTAVKLPWGGRDKRGRDMRTMACHATWRQAKYHGWRKEKCVYVGGVVAEGGGLPEG